MPKLRGTVADELNRIVTDPAVRAAFGSVTLYTGLPPDETPAMQIVGLIAMLADEFYLPEGVMGRIPEVLAAEFVRLGGEVHLNTPVRGIVVERGRVSAIELARGEQVLAERSRLDDQRNGDLHIAVGCWRCACRDIQEGCRDATVAEGSVAAAGAAQHRGVREPLHGLHPRHAAVE